MSRLRIQGLTKRFGPVTALDGADLAVEPGHLTAVLGPSGCGKTTLLRCVAGFERPDAGRIHVDGREIAGARTHIPPQRRGIAVVPQEGALFPHLSVRDNVGYGVRRGQRRTRVEEALELVGLSGYGDRMPHELSGGQRQRVAVARALAPRPALILLDEPFSALDAALRVDVRTDIREALRAAGATAVLVTHDQSEALSLADQVAVMRDGRIAQSGTPAAVYHEPADAWIAAFVGDAVLLPATVTGGHATTPLGTLPVVGPPAGPTTVMLRPEQIRLRPPADTGIRALVEDRQFYGHDAVVGLRLDDGTRITARLAGTERVTIGATVTVHVRGSARAWPDGGRATSGTATG